MSIDNISTERLILIPITLAIISGLRNNNFEELEKLGVTAVQGWPTADDWDIFPILQASLEESKVPTGFETWMMVEKATMKVIGDIGFHGGPDDIGEVEIGYGIAEGQRGKGFGFEALRAITDWALSQEKVKAIKADCLISNGPSSRILEKVGMKETKRDQEMIYWELKRHK